MGVLLIYLGNQLWLLELWWNGFEPTMDSWICRMGSVELGSGWRDLWWGTRSAEEGAVRRLRGGARGRGKVEQEPFFRTLRW